MSRNHQISTSANPAPPPVEPYILRPPEWRGPLSSEADLGFPDFYPSRPAHGQDEDCLSELFVKQGYVSKWGISQASESFSVHGVLLKELGSQAGLARMGSTLSSLLSTRQASASSIGPSTYRLPPRYTLHDSKRLTFVADLANPLVPLHKLSKSIPHGFKGGELLEMLWSNGVSLERGVWFAKVVGASEMQRPQGKPQPPPNHYSLEWTNACTTWLKKQLAEITLPSVPRPGFSVKQAFKSILSDPQSRERWVAKWNFSCSLTRSFFAHSLLDNRTFLSWLVQQIAPANLAQIGFVSRLIEEYLEQILASGALARLMVEGVAAKTMEIVGGSAKGGAGEKLEEVKIGLARILQSTFLQAPTLFVSPKLYTLYSNLFNLVLSETPEMTLPASPAAREEPLALAVIAAMREQWEEIKRRNVGLLFMSGGGGGWSPRRQAMADINILDSICSTSDMAQISLSFFTTVPTPPPSSKRSSSSSSSSSKPTTSSSTAQAFFPTKLDILLSWSIAYAQFGAHRPSSVSTLLLHHRARHPGCDAEVQELVFKWVAESEVAAKEENREAVAETIGELMRVGVVGYAGLLMRLMSRGLTAGFRDGGNEPSSQLKILRSIPLYSSTSSLLSQRRVALYGLRASTGSSDDDALAELVNQELDAAFPELAAQSVPSPNEMEDDSEPRTGSMPQLATLLGAPKFIQIDCVHRWLKKKGLSSSSDDLNLNSELLAKLLYLLEQVRDFTTMLELLFSALECPSSNSLISPIILAFKRYADVWTAMEAKGTIAEALFEKHLDLRGAPTPHRELLEVLFEMGEVGCLSEEDRTVVVNDMSVFEKSFFPSSHHPNPPPSNLDEVQMLSHELDPQAGPALATTLWYRYHAFDEWPFVVWQNVVLAIALLTSAVSDPTEQLIVVDRYARFLDEVHKHIPSGLDRHLRRWFRERADQDQTSDVFGRGLDGAMVNLLLQLALAGCIETVTIVDEVVLPVWKLCALKCRSNGSEAIFSSPLAISLQSVNLLATRLLLVNSPSLFNSSSSTSSQSSSLPPRNLEQIQRFQTSAVACFEDSSFVKLVTHLPFVVALEVALPSGDPLAASCGSIWAGLSKHQSLKVAAFRHSGTIKEAFLRPWWPGGERSAEVSLDGRLIDALKDLVSDGNQIDPTHSPTVYDWRKVVTRLTPWRWSRSVLELQLSLKQLAIRSSSESTAPEAEALLANLTRTVFERNLSSDETDLICEGLAGTEVGPIEKFAISGLDRLADILVSYDPSSPAAQERFTSFTDSAGNVLRVLSGTLAQARTPEGESPPRAPSSAQDRLPEAILEMLQKLEGQLIQVHRVEGSSKQEVRVEGSSSLLNQEAARTEGSLSTSQLRSLLILMLRSLHVALGFSRMGIIDLWTTKAKTSMEPFLKVQMGLISMHAGTQVLEEGLFALLIDTLWYYIDELPKDLRAGCISTLRNLQISCAYERNPSIPDDLRSQIKRILPYVSPDPLVENLVVSTNPSDPSLVDAVKAQARPWEWIEFTDPPASNPTHREAYPASQVVKNNASMNLTLFQAEGTRDRLPEPSTSSKFAEPASTKMEEEPWKAFESERSYADDLEGSTTFAKDWARSRVRREEGEGASGGDDSKSSVDGSGSTAGGAAPSPMHTVPTPTASTSTLPVPSSSRPSTTSKRKASVSSSSTSKAARGSTAADAVVIEDDDEPPAKVQKQGGRTGGKTTGGKTTAAKAPAGGKKGRKKSGN